MATITVGRNTAHRCCSHHFRRRSNRRQPLFGNNSAKSQFAVSSAFSRAPSFRQSVPGSIPRSPRSRSFYTVSFSGAGHLMPYHLGVARTLLRVSRDQEMPPTTNDPETTETGEKPPNALLRLPIRSVSGSSSGAIAATVMTLMPHRLEEYTDRFIQDRGYAFRNLREMLLEEIKLSSQLEPESAGNGGVHRKGLWSPSSPLLSICTTRCSDGGIELFSFGDGNNDIDIQPQDSHERLLKAIEASCKIPLSFHPFDMFALHYKDLLNNLPATPGTSHNDKQDTYPCEEGVVIDGNGYVDGGIAAPFPPTPLDGDQGCTGRIVVSPISGEYFYDKTSIAQQQRQSEPLLMAIRPENDSSWKVPFVNSLTLSGSGESVDDSPKVAVRATASLQNLRVLTMAIGVVPSRPNHDSDDNRGGGILRDWYERGQEDTLEMLDTLKHS